MKTLFLRIAGFAIKVVFEPGENFFYRNKCIEDITKHYDGFIIKKNPKLVHYTLRFIDARNFPIQIKKEIGKKYIDYFIGEEQHRGTTFYSISMAQFEIVLMNIVSDFFKDLPGFFIHSSASLINGKAVLYIGDSGAGKSTIVHLLSNMYRPLADDMSIVRKVDGSYYLFQTPHHEKSDSIVKDSNGYKISAIYLLHQAKQCEIHTILNKDEVIQRLIPQIVIYFNENKTAIKHFLNFAAEFDSFYELWFTKKVPDIAAVLKSNTGTITSA